MITADAPLLQSILDAELSLAAKCAQRFGRFVRTEFNPQSEDSWATADKLWRTAIMTRDVERDLPR